MMVKALIADLLVGHGVGGVFGVNGLEEHRKQIATIAGGSAALVDHGIDDGVEVGFSLPDALHRRDGETLDNVGERHECEGKKAHECVDRGGDALNLFARLNIKVEKALPTMRRASSSTVVV